MKRVLCLLLATVTVATAQDNVNKVDSHTGRSNERTEIRIPDMLGYKAIKGDFHLHTVFSDGNVWPTDRVAEAWRDGLDVIAITDHIEYRPHKKFMNADHNTSYDIALPAANKRGIHLIKATELTHSDKTKGGHINALFITDANAMERPSSSKDLTLSVDAAVAQGAYLIWNHPGWDTDTCMYHAINANWVEQGKIKAVEVFNHMEYYPRAVSWVGMYGLTPIAATDSHATRLDTYADNVLPPFTVVLAKENTIESIKEAMFAGRTIAIFNAQAAAKPEYLKALFEAAVSYTKLPNGNVVMTNNSDLPFDIRAKELNVLLLPGQSRQFKYTAPIDVEIANLHVDEKSNLKVKIEPK